MRSWSETAIENDLRLIANAVGHFPSCRELAEMGRGDLANQVSKRGGFLNWSKRIGIGRQTSESDVGWEGEEAAASRLESLGFSVVRRDGVKCPFDLLVDNVLRVDVKAARFCRYGYCSGWFYRSGKHPQSDVILLWQLDTQNFYVLPWFRCPTTNITVSQDGGKYAPYRNNVALIREMVALRKVERDAHSAGRE